MIDQETGLSIPSSVLATNMAALKEAWVMGQEYGCGSLAYCREENRFYLSRFPARWDDYSPGEVGMGLLVSAIAAERNGQPWDNVDFGYGKEPVANFFGQVNYVLRRYSSLMSCELSESIEEYLQLKKHLLEKVKKSYGRLLTLEGTTASEAPLLDEIKEKLMEDLAKGGDSYAPAGSGLSGITGTIADIDKAIFTYQDAIAAEAGIPAWLLFNRPVANASQLEERANFATGLFVDKIYIPLLNLLSLQGYDYVSIEPPSYRDRLFDTAVEENRADAKYKLAAAERSRASAYTGEVDVVQKIKNLLFEGSEDIGADDAEGRNEDVVVDRPGRVL